MVLDHWNDQTIELLEEFKVMLLNNSNEVLGVCSISKGGITGTMVDIRLVFALILKSGATAFITVHNHPSGNLKASSADIRLYRKMKQACELLDLNYLDNLIITTQGYSSFSDEMIS